MNIQIVRSRPANAPILTHVAKESKKYWGYSENLINQWEKELTFTPQEITEELVFHIEIDGEIVGVCEMSQSNNSDTFEIEHLWVLPQYINQGFGRMLLEHTKKAAEKLGAKSFRVVSDPHAEGFYLKMGLRKIGEEESSIKGRMLPVLQSKLE